MQEGGPRLINGRHRVGVGRSMVGGAERRRRGDGAAIAVRCSPRATDFAFGNYSAG
jgi:hypothetical protein